MNISLLQIGSVVFAVIMIFVAYVYYRRAYFGLLSLLSWSFIFMLLIAITVVPQKLVPFISFFQVARLFDLFTVIGLFFLLTLTFINFTQLHKIQNKINKIVQEDALRDKDKDKESTS